MVTGMEEAGQGSAGRFFAHAATTTAPTMPIAGSSLRPMRRSRAYLRAAAQANFFTFTSSSIE